MLKLLGSVLIFGACTALGLSAREKLLHRLRALDAVLAALDYMANELECRLTPLPAMIETLAASPNRLTAELFGALQQKMNEDNGQSLPFKWCCALREGRDSLGLDEPELSILCDMAGFLGRYDATQQIKNIDYSRSRLADVRARVENETRVRGNLYRTCGVCIGVMAVLILI